MAFVESGDRDLIHEAKAIRASTQLRLRREQGGAPAAMA